MQLFQPCSSPEQSKAIADLSPDLGDGWGMTFCALSSDLGDGGGVTFCALSSGLSVGSGMTGVTFCAQPMMTQASATSAIESLNCTLFFHPHLQPPSLAVATRLTPSATHVTTHRCSLCGGGAVPRRNLTWTLRFEADVTSLEAKIDTSAEDLDIFGKGGQPCRPRRSAPTACTHCLSREADSIEGCTEDSPEEAELAGPMRSSYEAVRWPDEKLPGGNGIKKSARFGR